MMWSLLIMSLFTVSKTQGLITGGKTSQSSNYEHGFNYSSARAVDGDLNQCAHTLNNNNNNWWSIDLLGLYEISNITIYNVNQGNIHMEGAQIRIGNSSETDGTSNNLCTNITEFKLTQNNTFQCDNGSMWGRYVTIFKEKNFLILCEVWINGTRKESGLVLISETRTWEGALNHCRDHNMELVYILDNVTQSWAELEANKSNSTFVWLGLRYTCTLGFWFWMGDHPLTYERWAPDQQINECDMSVAMETTGNHSWFSKADNEMFNFICRF